MEKLRQNVPVPYSFVKMQNPNEEFKTPDPPTKNNPSSSNEQQKQKSCCKIKGHSSHEIVFACYECKDTYCIGCLDAHKDHTLIYFKDSHIV